MARKTQGRRAINARRRNETAAALGALLGFYRRLDGRSQTELSSDASLHKSETALYESGKRLPSGETLTKIANALGLDAFQVKQLQLIAGYPNRAEFAGQEWILPEDVVHGVPIFLRSIKRESELQELADISEMWVVAIKPLALHGAMYELLKKRLLHEKTKFVYFVGGGTGEQSFQTLWRDLCAETPKAKEKILEKIECILAPETIFLNHFAIANPGQQSRMFGRAIMYQNGLPVGFYRMDQTYVTRAFEILDAAYRDCARNVDKTVTLKWGAFRMLKPQVED